MAQLIGELPPIGSMAQQIGELPPIGTTAQLIGTLLPSLSAPVRPVPRHP